MKGTLNFPVLFANAREDDFRRVATGSQDPLQLATRDDIKARAQLGQQAEHSQVGIRFDGITDHDGMLLKGLTKSLIRRCDSALRIDIQGGVELLCEGFGRNILNEQFVILIVDECHELSLLLW